MYRNVICQQISNLFSPLLVERLLQIYFTRQFERAVEVCNSHWFILQQLCLSSLLCDAHFVRSIWHCGELNLIPVSSDLPLYVIFLCIFVPFVDIKPEFFRYWIYVNQYQWFTTCEPRKPGLPRGYSKQCANQRSSTVRHASLRSSFLLFLFLLLFWWRIKCEIINVIFWRHNTFLVTYFLN